MLKSFNFITALISFAAAVKQGTETQTEGNMGQTKTFKEFAIEDLDEVQTEIETWYKETANPFIKEHRKMVFEAALAEAEQKYGTLLETCDEGTKCREEIMKDLKSSIGDIWRQIIIQFRKSVKANVRETRTTVKESWTDLVECGEKHPCCGYTEVQWQNNFKMVVIKRKELSELIHKWEDFEARRRAIEARCPEHQWPACPSE